MSAPREVLFSLLLNASWQIALFALGAKAFSRLVARARPKEQHWFFLGVLALCLVLPFANTFWTPRPSAFADVGAQGMLQRGSPSYQDFWLWKGRSITQRQRLPGRGAEDVCLALWGAALLYQVIRLSRGLHRVHSLRRGARLLSPAEIGSMRACKRVTFFASTDLAHPVTIGVLRPSVILPSKLLPALDRSDVMAIVAHEYAHILRGDFMVHLACEIFSLPVALHPGVRYVMSRISQTRELACDEYAAVQLGERRLYAHALLRLASLCVQMKSGSTVGHQLSYQGQIIISRQPDWAGIDHRVAFSSGAVFARAMSRQVTEASKTAQSFAGSWNW